jgi:hypothetical protein
MRVLELDVLKGPAAHRLHSRLIFHPGHGAFLRNVGSYMDSTALCLRKEQNGKFTYVSMESTDSNLKVEEISKHAYDKHRLHRPPPPPHCSSVGGNNL